MGPPILKHTDGLSFEALCERWVESPYYRLFSGEEFFRHDVPFDRSSLTRWRQRTGEEKIAALIQAGRLLTSRSCADAARSAKFRLHVTRGAR